MAEEPAGERTEQATPKRMKEVREKGQLSKSQDLTAWLGVGAAAVMLSSTVATGASTMTEQAFGIPVIAASPEPGVALRMLGEGLGSVMVILGPLLVAVLVIVVIGAVAQGGVHLKKFRGKFEQFDLVKGIKRTFGMQALWQGAKALLKTGVVGFVLYLVIVNLMPALTAAGGHSVAALLDSAAGAVATLLQFAIAAGIALAIADVMVVMRRNRKRTRMTKKEVRDENKNTDGDPLIKSQRRSRQLALSRNRMIAAIGDSDVVLVNPTQYAVALKYEPGKSAPRVVAKGAGIIAARIRDEAERTRVPMVRDIPLTRTLHSLCELGQEIPPELYDAVARVLAFVMALRRRGAAHGTHTIAGAAPALPSVDPTRRSRPRPPALRPAPTGRL